MLQVLAGKADTLCADSRETNSFWSTAKPKIDIKDISENSLSLSQTTILYYTIKAYLTTRHALSSSSVERIRLLDLAKINDDERDQRLVTQADLLTHVIFSNRKWTPVGSWSSGLDGTAFPEN